MRANNKILIFVFLLLVGCAQSTALLGPAITIGSTGNVMQAGFSYGSNLAVQQKTGKTPGEHVVTYVDEKKKQKKIEKEMVNYLESHIEMMRKKLIFTK